MLKRFLQAGLLLLPVFVGALLLWWSPAHPDPTVNGCVVLFLIVGSWWTVGLVPLYITALLVPILATVLRVMRDPLTGAILDASTGAGLIVRSMFGQVTLVLLGAFTVSAAVRKYRISQVIGVDLLASWWVAEGPGGFAGLAAVLMCGCLWLSVVMPHEAVMVVALTSIDGILWRLDKLELEGEDESEDQIEDQMSAVTNKVNENLKGKDAGIHGVDSQAKMLILALMVGCEMGGIISPISSPQNMFAYHEAAAAFGISWVRWLTVSLPVAHLALIPTWALLIWIYGPPSRRRLLSMNRNKIDNRKMIDNTNNIDNAVEPKAIVATVLVLLSVLLWASSPWLEDGWLGSLGIISTVPFVLFFGTGLLNIEEPRIIPWEIILLSMGGLALAAAARSSGLYRVIGEELGRVLRSVKSPADGWLWVRAALLGITALAFSTFKGHLVTALLLLPVLRAIYVDAGMERFPNGLSEGALLYLLTTFACTIGMALPVSGIVNMTAASLHSPRRGLRYLELVDFVAIGAPASLFALISVLAVGFPLLRYS